MESIVALEVWVILIVAPCVVSFILGEMHGWSRARNLFDSGRNPDSAALEALRGSHSGSAVSSRPVTPRPAGPRFAAQSLPEGIKQATGSRTPDSPGRDKEASEMLRRYRHAILAMRAQMPRHDHSAITLCPPSEDEFRSGFRISDAAPLSPDMRGAYLALRREANEAKAGDTIPTHSMGPAY